MIRFIARHRHTFTGLIVFVFLVGLVYFGVKTQTAQHGLYDDDTYTGLAFGTSIKKTLYSDDVRQRESVSNQIDDILKELDDKLSYRNVDSQVAFCNRNYAVDGLTELDDDILSILGRELEINKETKGAFSPCILPLTQLWGIEDGYEDIPSDDLIKQYLNNIDADKIEIADGGVIIHASDMKIDFGAVGKGVAADYVMDELEKSGIPGAVVSIGGTIAIYGDKGNGTPWHIGIQDPRGDEGYVFGVLTVSEDTVVSTSGDYEKYFEKDGKRYHHIIDPSTGYPADNGLISVTIVSDDGFLSDAMSTACFVMGLDEGLKYAEEKGVGAIFVTSDKKVYITKNLKKYFNIKAEGYELSKK